MENINLPVDKKAEMLDKTNWADEFSWKEIENLVKYFHVAKAAAGAKIINEGEHDAYMCIIAEGSVSVIKENMASQNKILSTVKKGKTFGEMTLFDGEARSASVRAAEQTVMLVLTRDKLNLLLEESPKLGIKLLYKLGTLISQRLRMTSGMLIDYI